MKEASVYIVHLWGTVGPPTAFRAAVQRAGTDESAWFTEAGELVRYFEQQAVAPVGADDCADKKVER